MTVQLTHRQVNGWSLCLVIMLAGVSARWWVPRLLAYGPSSSLAQGWYVRAFPARPLRVGDLIVLDVPEALRPHMPRDLPAVRLLKQVAGVQDDYVCWLDDRMVVWDTETDTITDYPYWPDTTPSHPTGCQGLTAGDMVITGTHPRSRDSRYLGVVAQQLLQFRVVPVWTWEAE